jgi:hypothetical protein
MEMLLYLTQMVDEASRSERFEEADVSIRPLVSGFAMLDFSAEQSRDLVQRGHAAASEALQNLKVKQTKKKKICNLVIDVLVSLFGFLKRFVVIDVFVSLFDFLSAFL